MKMELPFFEYHPNPILTGSIIRSNNRCKCCGRNNGYIYIGPIYTTAEDLEQAICPWCIKNGNAHEKFDVEFVDPDAVGGYGEWEVVKHNIIEEVCFKTPGFCGWQQEQWWTHCGDAAEFLGACGYDTILDYGMDLEIELKREAQLDNADWEKYFKSLDKEKGPTAYLFRCRKCKKIGGYSDKA